eukprot:COSAG02_NODE_5667_length_4143_cov_1.935955_3_plen_44_part_00
MSSMSSTIVTGSPGPVAEEIADIRIVPQGSLQYSSYYNTNYYE